MILFNLETPFRPSIKCGPVGALVGSASSVFGMLSGERQAEANASMSAHQIQAQKEENQLNRDYNTVEAEKARQFTTSERLAQQQFQSQQWQKQQLMADPLKVQSLRQAGINPAVAYGQGMSVQGGSVSAPTGASSPAASFSTGLSPVPYQAPNLASNFSMLASGLQSLATAKEKGANVDMIYKQIDSLQVDMQWKQALKEGVALDNALKHVDLKYKDRQLIQNLQEQVFRMALTKDQSELVKSQKIVQDGLVRLNDSLADKHSQESDLLRLQIASFDKTLQSTLDLQRSERAKNLAEASEARTRIVGLEFDNAIKKIDSENAAATASQKLAALRESYMKQANIDKTERVKAEAEFEKVDKILEMYRKNGNKVALDAALDNFNEHFPIIGGFIKAFAK